MGILVVTISIILCFFSSFQYIHSLSTISISNTNNKTIICALINSIPNQQPYINCSSFPPGIQIPTISTIQSPSGIVGGNNFFCYVSTFTSSSISIMGCWRFSNSNTNIAYKRIYRGPVLKELDAGNSHICGIVNSTNRLQCWQWLELNSKTSSITESVSVGEHFVCGLTGSRQVQCLGTNTNVTKRVPGGNYSMVAAGSQWACAIAINGTLVCWGDNVGKTPPGDFKALALGDQRGCALTNPNGTVVCWGGNGMFSIPESLRETSFLALESKGDVFCGVTTLDLTLYCWGNDNLDPNVPIFNGVIPGPCKNECPCGILPASARLCDGGQMICNPCSQNSDEFPPSSLPPSSSPVEENSSWNGKVVAFFVVGCVGSLALIIAIFLFFSRYFKIRGSQIHDSGRLDEAEMPRTERATPVLEKRLSQLVSMGNKSYLEDFSLETLIKATDDFSEENKIGSGSFGYVFHGDGGWRWR
ncbi:hypothetical protein Leryth_010740 [Lithospermum erythrorhizon]|nr:hypothetical protein Leryth_010740 [Lithospermum erythrorhizon]